MVDGRGQICFLVAGAVVSWSIAGCDIYTLTLSAEDLRNESDNGLCEAKNALGPLSSYKPFVRSELIAEITRRNLDCTDSETQLHATSKAKHTIITEINVQQILLRTEVEAQKIINQLKLGVDFGELARQHSVGSLRSQGGRLGWIRRGDTVASFTDVAFALKPGEFSQQPVETEWGWHVILVKDVR